MPQREQKQHELAKQIHIRFKRPSVRIPAITPNEVSTWSSIPLPVVSILACHAVNK